MKWSAMAMSGGRGHSGSIESIWCQHHQQEEKFSAVFGNTGSMDSGGISNHWGQLTVDNATVNDNSGLHGGGVYNDSGSVTISGSSFTSNDADVGGAWYNINPWGTVDFQGSSSYTGNQAGDCERFYDVNASPQCVD